MPNWLRFVLAIAASFVAWFAVATLGNLAVRGLFPGYVEVEKAMDFSLGMLVARLALGAAASLAAGAASVVMSPHSRVATYLFALLLLALFVPIHLSLWSKFPVWYHLVFLSSLVPLVLLGAKLRRTPLVSAA